MTNSLKTTRATNQDKATVESSIRDELVTAFTWARMSSRERDDFRRRHRGDVPSIIANAPASVPFDFTAFQEQSGKKNFGEYLSRFLASRFARALAPHFDGILPDPTGRGHESRARTSKGYKKLDVNYSTPQLGLGLGISIKTINSRDAKSRRYTKNYTRVDAELRAEAADYHERQPYAVMIAVIILPIAACDDGTNDTPSSFGAAVRLFRHRAGRDGPSGSLMLFERVFIGLYETEASSLGSIAFMDVMTAPPRVGRPARTLPLEAVVSEIVAEYDRRNNPTFTWADGLADDGTAAEDVGEVDEG